MSATTRARGPSRTWVAACPVEPSSRMRAVPPSASEPPRSDEPSAWMETSPSTLQVARDHAATGDLEVATELDLRGLQRAHHEPDGLCERVVAARAHAARR